MRLLKLLIKLTRRLDHLVSHLAFHIYPALMERWKIGLRYKNVSVTPLRCWELILKRVHLCLKNSIFLSAFFGGKCRHKRGHGFWMVGLRFTLTIGYAMRPVSPCNFWKRLASLMYNKMAQASKTVKLSEVLDINSLRGFHLWLLVVDGELFGRWWSCCDSSRNSRWLKS